MPRFEGDYEVVTIARGESAIPIAVGGLPSPESIFTIHCLADIARRLWGDVKVLPLNTGEDGKWLTEATSRESALPFFDTPDTHARELLLATRAPIVVVTGDFAETARFCMVARNLDTLQAARFVSQSFSCLEPLQREDNVRWITVDKAANLPEWIDQVAGWLGLQPSAWESDRQQMLADYAAWPTVEVAIHALVQFADRASAAWERLPTAIQPLFETLGMSYRSGSIDTVFWPADCILEPGHPAVPVSDAIPLTGPARMLTFGPFMHLPPGRWSARYQFGLDDHPAGNAIEFDVVNGDKVLASRSVQVYRPGKFGLDCEFELEESRLPVENRAILKEGSIGGYFKPDGIWVRRC